MSEQYCDEPRYHGDTPKADAAEAESIAAFIRIKGADAVFPSDGYDFARELETELAAERETLCKIREKQDNWREVARRQYNLLSASKAAASGTAEQLAWEIGYESCKEDFEQLKRADK